MWASEGSVPGPQTGRGGGQEKLAANPQRGAAASACWPAFGRVPRSTTPGIALFWRAQL
ncbi:hypothetical protein SAMN04487913_104186 [Arthrobacter sp. ok362]|nr:hypothetical protein SAMN04487913_104186 [Arthrobacter sp. ok362]